MKVHINIAANVTAVVYYLRFNFNVQLYAQLTQRLAANSGGKVITVQSTWDFLVLFSHTACPPPLRIVI